jgi:hypothetical protein
VAGRADALGCRTEIVDVADNDIGAAFGEPDRYRLSDPAGASRYQGDSSGVGLVSGDAWHVIGLSLRSVKRDVRTRLWSGQRRPA